MISGSWKIKIWGKYFTFCWFWLGKMHQNGLSGTYLGSRHVPNPMAQVSSLYVKWFLKNQNFRQKFHILLILTGKNASKWLQWCILSVRGMLNPMALVSSLYDKWFLKNQNFQRQVSIKWGYKPSKWNGTYAAVLLASHSTPTPCLQNPMHKPSCHKSSGSHHNSKSTCHTKF